MTRKAELLDPIDEAEIDVITFNFTRGIRAGETITGLPLMTCETETGVDGSASSMLVSPAQVSGMMVLQQVRGRLVGNRYLIRCEAQLSSGRRLALSVLLPVLRLAA